MADRVAGGTGYGGGDVSVYVGPGGGPSSPAPAADAIPLNTIAEVKVVVARWKAQIAALTGDDKAPGAIQHFTTSLDTYDASSASQVTQMSVIFSTLRNSCREILGELSAIKRAVAEFDKLHHQAEGEVKDQFLIKKEQKVKVYKYLNWLFHGGGIVWTGTFCVTEEKCETLKCRLLKFGGYLLNGVAFALDYKRDGAEKDLVKAVIDLAKRVELIGAIKEQFGFVEACAELKNMAGRMYQGLRKIERDKTLGSQEICNRFDDLSGDVVVPTTMQNFVTAGKIQTDVGLKHPVIQKAKECVEAAARQQREALIGVVHSVAQGAEAEHHMPYEGIDSLPAVGDLMGVHRRCDARDFSSLSVGLRRRARGSGLTMRRTTSGMSTSSTSSAKAAELMRSLKLLIEARELKKKAPDRPTGLTAGAQSAPSSNDDSGLASVEGANRRGQSFRVNHSLGTEFDEALADVSAAPVMGAMHEDDEDDGTTTGTPPPPLEPDGESKSSGRSHEADTPPPLAPVVSPPASVEDGDTGTPSGVVVAPRNDSDATHVVDGNDDPALYPPRN